MQLIKKVPSIPKRRADTHKGDYGHVFVLAGSPGKTGAAYLTSKGALRSGAGLVTLGIPESLNPIMEVKLTCCMTLPLPETEEHTLSDEGREDILAFANKCSALAIGPGLSTHPATRRLVLWLLQVVSTPIVLDADGLNAVGQEFYAMQSAGRPFVLTPHPGEMARMLNAPSAAHIQNNRLKHTMKLAQEGGVVVALKGHETVVTDAKRVYINKTGNPGMATAGAGDVLTGVIAALLAQGYDAFDAACIGVYVHGLAGDLACAEKGEIGMIATDILNKLPEAFKTFDASQSKNDDVPKTSPSVP